MSLAIKIKQILFCSFNLTANDRNQKAKELENRLKMDQKQKNA